MSFFFFLLCPLDELILLSSNLVLAICPTYLMSIMEKEQENENIQETEGKMLDVKNNFNEFAELSVSFTYACL